MNKEQTLKILLWAVPVIFGAGGFYSMVGATSASLTEKVAEIEVEVDGVIHSGSPGDFWEPEDPGEVEITKVSATYPDPYSRTKKVYPEIPIRTIDKVYSRDDLIKYVGKQYMSWDKNGYTFDGQVIRKDGDAVNVPFCRECTSQPRCSKWNGKFPYERVEGKIGEDKYSNV